MAALNTIYEAPYRLELRRIGPVVDGKTVESKGTWPLAVAFAGTTVYPLEPEASSAVAQRLQTLRGNLRARRAAQCFQSAVESSDLIAEPLVAYAPLVGFHLCIETILGAVGNSEASDDEQVAAKSALTERLRIALNDAEKGLDDHVQAVLTAKAELDRVSHAAFRRRLAAAVSRLGLNEAVHQRLEQFYKFRNDHLGHPNASLSNEQIHHWVPEASHLARTMLSAYLDLLGDRAPTTFSTTGLEPLAKGSMSSVSVNFPSMDVN